MEVIFGLEGAGYVLLQAAKERDFPFVVDERGVYRDGHCYGSYHRCLRAVVDPREVSRSARYTRIGLYLSGFVVCVVVLFGVGKPVCFLCARGPRNPNAKFLGLSMEHILGTDSLGRDVAIRILKGTEAFFFPSFAALITVACGVGEPLLSMPRRNTQWCYGLNPTVRYITKARIHHSCMQRL